MKKILQTVKENALELGIITLINIFFFGQSLTFYFFSDDFHHLDVNNRIKYFWDAFSYYWQSNSNLNLYRPTTNIFFHFNIKLFGPNPFPFHLEMLIMIIASSLLLYVLVNKIVENKKISLVSTLIFSVLPLRAEPAVWAADIGDTLIVLFALLMFIFLWEYKEKHNKKYFFIALTFFVLALLSKEPAITLLVPVGYFLYTKKESIKGFLVDSFWFVMAAGFYLVNRAFYSSYLTSHNFVLGYQNPTIAMYYPTNLISQLSKFLSALFAVPNLRYIASHQLRSGIFIISFLAFVFIGLLIYAYINLRNQFDWLLIAIMILLLPILATFSVPFVVDRYLYLSSVGLVILMAIFLRAINPSKYLFFAAITISVMLFIGYSILLTKRLEVTAESSKISTTFKSQIKEIGEDYQLLAVPTAVTNNVFRYWTFTEYAFSEIKHMEILNELILRKNNRIEVVSQSVITDKNPTISFDGVNLYYIGAYGTIKPALFPDLPIYFFNGKDLVKY